jgi:tripartite-type tricarboxylate transporter receptor subunit TctC
MIPASSGLVRAAIVCGFAAGVLTVARSAPSAQNYPNHPIRLIVPFAPGGLNDTVARLLQPHLEKSLRVAVIIDNRPAASGIVGTEAVAKAQADGYTLLMVASSHTVIPATNPKLPYDADRSFAPIVMIGQNPFLFIVNATVPATTLGEFVALARAKPGKINYATVGAASQSHLVTELFSQRAGIKMQQIPYRGGAPAITATVAGETQFTIISPQAALPHVAAGTLRVIAAGSLTRDPQFPDIPTVAEQGYPGFEAIQWVGLLTTAGTPKGIVDRLNSEVNTAIRDPDLIARLAIQGMSPAGGTAEQFRTVIATEIANWTAVARAANITAD